MKRSIISRYAHTVCILLVVLIANVTFAQEKLYSFELFKRSTDDSFIGKIKNNIGAVMLLEEFMDVDTTMRIITVKDGIVKIDTLEHFIVKSYYDDSTYYYPIIEARSMYCTKDRLFIAFKRGIATYTYQDGKFDYDDITYFEEGTHFAFEDGKYYSYIMGIHNDKLVLGEQYFSDGGNYLIALYDINSKQITNSIQKYLGNSIMYHYYDVFNSFAANDRYISLMNMMEPVVYLYDYNLQLKDSINFAFNEDWKITKHIVDTNFALNKAVVIPNEPKNIIYLLDTINIMKYYANQKQLFVNDSILLILTKRMNVDSSDWLKLNINTKESKIILSCPKSGKTSPYVSLGNGTDMALFDKGIFTDYERELDEEEESIVYSLDVYYSDVLDFSTKTILLEDRKQNLLEVNPNDYDAVIVFDSYLCKTCFTKELENAKLLFIYYDSNISKIQRLTWYRQLKKIYPNAEVLFNHNNQFSVRKNIVVNPISIIPGKK